MQFSRQEYWNGLLFPSPGDLPNPGVATGFPVLQSDFLPAELSGKPVITWEGQNPLEGLLDTASWAHPQNF